mgnify:CR=1 FL=1|tara:strand:- start:217 stop:534 length:318 start_codon:yes stop_codon:yes gene_type:complete
MVNAWLSHVKSTMKLHPGKKFKDVLKAAKKTYKKSKKAVVSAVSKKRKRRRRRKSKRKSKSRRKSKGKRKTKKKRRRRRRRKRGGANHEDVNMPGMDEDASGPDM